MITEIFLTISCFLNFLQYVKNETMQNKLLQFNSKKKTFVFDDGYFITEMTPIQNLQLRHMFRMGPNLFFVKNVETCIVQMFHLILDQFISH